MIELKILLLALLGAFMNWFIRGGGWKSALYDNKPPFDIPGKFINAFVFGVSAWCLSGSAVAAAILSVGMYAGSVSKLGIYVSAMKGEIQGVTEQWGVDGLTIRGAIWGLALAAYPLMLMPDIRSIAGAFFIIAGAAQGIIYDEMIRFYKNRTSDNWFNHWTVAEMIHGALIWLPLAMI